MSRFLAGFIIGVLFGIAGYFLIYNITNPAPEIRPNDLGRCSAGSDDCRPNPGRYRGISGSARLDADSHLVVHDSHDEPSQAAMPRLGIIKDLGKGHIATYPSVSIRINGVRTGKSPVIWKPPADSPIVITNSWWQKAGV